MYCASSRFKISIKKIVVVVDGIVVVDVVVDVVITVVVDLITVSESSIS